MADKVENTKPEPKKKKEFEYKLHSHTDKLSMLLEMMFDKRAKRKTKVIKGEKTYNAIFPLAVPLLAGPAAITSVITSIFMSALASKRKCQNWHLSFVKAGSTAE